jgi:hypothetical protein
MAKARRTAAEWQEKVDLWKQSGLKAPAWCRENGESYVSFLFWRKRLGACVPEKSQPSKTAFLELGSSPEAIRLEFQGITIHLEPGFDALFLGEILRALKAIS